MEPVSRKRTCKVGPGRFIPRCRRNKIILVVARKIDNIYAHNCFVFYSCIETTHRPGSDTTVGDRIRNLKFSTHHQDQSMESSSNKGEGSASTYHCRSRAEAFKRTGLMESCSSCSKSPMTKRGGGRHLRVQHTYGWGRRLLLLDPARGKERLMEIQQHNGVVVEAAGSRQGFAKHQREGEVSRGEREAPGKRCCCPPTPPLFIGGERGGSAPLDLIYG